MADRSKFKATKIETMKAVVEEDNKDLSSGSGKKEFVEIEEGPNKLRLAPAFPGEDNFYHKRVQHWITLEDNNGDEVRRTVLNARAHGNSKKDIIEEYISLAKLKLDASDEDDQTKLEKITDWKSGLLPQTTWWTYAWKITGENDKKFGIWEFKKSVRDQINEACIIEDDEDAITVDPFTDPDTGRRITLTFKSKAKAADKYKIRVAEKATPLTDDDLDELDKNKPLSEILVGVYTQKDFEKALEGLRFFDAKHEIGIYDEEDFQDIINELKGKYKAGKEDDKPTSKTSPKIKNVPASKSKVKDEDDEDEELEDEDEATAPVKKTVSAKAKSAPLVEEEEEDDEDSASPFKDQFDEMDREELKEYIAETGLVVKVMKGDSDDTIRENIRKVTTKSTSKKVVEEEEEETPAPKKGMTKMEELKAKMKAKIS